MVPLDIGKGARQFRMVDCRSTYGIEGLDDLERHLCDVSDSVNRREAFKDVSSPGFLLPGSEVGLGLERVALPPTTSELVACEH